MSFGKDALEKALTEMVLLVDNATATKTPLAGVTAPEFCFVLTPKQRAAIDKVCVEKAWLAPTMPGICITLGDVKHVYDARTSKDKCDTQCVIDILVQAYRDISAIWPNTGKDGDQAFLLNSAHTVFFKGQKYNAVAVLALESNGPETRLAPRTAYHADGAKVRRIRR